MTENHAETHAAGDRAARRAQTLIFALVFFCGAYFYNAQSWNQTARLDVIFSFVEPGTADQYSFRITSFVPRPDLGINTGDWARRPGRPSEYYANKAPGPMLLGIPVYALLYHAERWLGVVPETAFWSRVNAYLLNLVLSVLPLAASATVMYRLLARDVDRGRRRAMAALTVVICLGTLLLPFATQLWGHTTAAACLVLSLGAVTSRRPQHAGLGGVLAGVAVLTDYTAAITVMLTGAALLATRRFRRFGYFVGGGLGPFLLYAAYHYACFGNCLTPASSYSNPVFLESSRLGGLFGGISQEVLAGLLVSPYRGVFCFMPITVVALFGMWTLRHRRARGPVLFCVINVTAYLLLNSSFNGWHGGACAGPRYLIPALPFLGYLCRPAVERLSAMAPGVPRRICAGGLLGLAGLSVCNMFAIAATSPLSPRDEPFPLRLCYRRLLCGRVQQWGYPPVRFGGEWFVTGPLQPDAAPPPEAWAVGGRAPWHRQAAVRGLTRFPGPSAAGDGGIGLAQCRLWSPRDGPADLHLEWDGRLTAWLNGVRVLDRRHDGFSASRQRLRLRQGGNGLTVRLAPPVTAAGAAPRFRCLVALPEGTALPPSADLSGPGDAYGAFNLGTVIGLRGPVSLLPLLVVGCVLFGLLMRGFTAGDSGMRRQR